MCFFEIQLNIQEWHFCFSTAYGCRVLFLIIFDYFLCMLHGFAKMGGKSDVSKWASFKVTALTPILPAMLCPKAQKDLKNIGWNLEFLQCMQLMDKIHALTLLNWHLSMSRALNLSYDHRFPQTFWIVICFFLDNIYIVLPSYTAISCCEIHWDFAVKSLLRNGGFLRWIDFVEACRVNELLQCFRKW